MVFTGRVCSMRLKCARTICSASEFCSRAKIDARHDRRGVALLRILNQSLERHHGGADIGHAQNDEKYKKSKEPSHACGPREQLTKAVASEC